MAQYLKILIEALCDSNRTWIIDPTNDFKIKRGPDMTKHRIDFSCGILMVQGNRYIVASGGDKETSVELMNPILDQEWITGKSVFHLLTYLSIQSVYADC